MYAINLMLSGDEVQTSSHHKNQYLRPFSVSDTLQPKFQTKQRNCGQNIRSERPTPFKFLQPCAERQQRFL
jgi:hypothetical protein